MAAIDCARAILRYVSDVDTAIALVAIAGAESNWREDAAGDYYGGYWSCDNGATSFGPWQVNIYWNRNWLPQLVGSSNPCDIARWLKNYDNNARAAAIILQRQGLCAWYTYEKWCSSNHNGRYRDYLSEAREAVNAALSESGAGAGGGGETRIPGEERVPGLIYLLAPFVALVAGASGAGLLVLWRKGMSITDLRDVLLRRLPYGRK